MYELLKGELAFYRGDFAEAKEQLRLAFENGRKWEQYEIENRSLFYLLRVYLSLGDAKRVELILAELKAELKEPFYLNRHFYYDIVTGWYNVQIGRKDMIAPWLKSDFSESSLISMARGLEKLVKARYYFAEKRYPAAIASLEIQSNMEIFLIGSIEMKALEAVCRYRLPDKEGAYKVLEEAYSLAAPAGLFMPFAELGKDMRSLVEAALRDKTISEKAPAIKREWLLETRRNAADYAKKIFNQQAGTGEKGSGRRSGRLSQRETDVLTGLSQGLTREEIAGAAAISPNTVKSVIRSIYSKLGALNQADAVRIAAKRGIL
jgi:LuxR family maltose regulon positive regulatory protein